MKIIVKIDGPILPGSISMAKSQCGKKRCTCKSRKPKLHGPYYRWTGIINGQRTTKTLSKETAQECTKRITRYKRLKRQIDALLEAALLDAPWTLEDID